MAPMTSLRKMSLAAWGLPLLVFAFGLAVTVTVATWHQRQNQDHVDQQLGFELRHLKETLAFDLKSYQQALTTIRSSTAGAADLEHLDFSALLSSRRKSEFPGALDFGFARLLARPEVSRYVAAKRRAGQPEFTLKDDDSQRDQLIVVDSQERDGRGNSILGVDLAVIPAIASAARLAAETNKPLLTEPLSGMDGEEETGLLLLLPVFQRDASRINSPKARTEIFGWLFARLAIEDVFVEVTPNLVEFELYDVSSGAEPILLYASRKFSAKGADQSGSALMREVRTNIGGRDWLVRVTPTATFWQRLALISPRLTFALGLLLTLMATLLIHLLASTRKRAEALAQRMTCALRVSEERFQDYSKSASDWFWETDAEMRFSLVSTGAEKSIGRPVTSVIGKRLDELTTPEDLQQHEKWNKYFSQLRRYLPFRDLELRFAGSQGEEFWCGISGLPHFDEHEKFAGYRGSGSNITLRKQAEIHLVEAMEMAQHASRMKSEFLANMSHEIRTPMNGVLGMIALLRQTDLNAEQQEFATTVQHSAEALLCIINDILDFSKVEAGRLDLEPIDFDLRAMTEEVNDILSVRASEKELDFAAMVEHDVPSRLRGDPGRLRQILINLAGNAIKFTEAGEVSIRVGLSSQTDDGVCLHVEVQDTGIGIAADKLEQLFNPFVQADGSITRKYGGTGLGLSISKRLVELMGGEIGVFSEEAQGSTFWFSVRLEHARGDAPRPAASLTTLADKRILVVDDHLTNRRLMEILLLDMQCLPLMVDSGKDALRVLDKEFRDGRPIDILITDMQMPVMDGEQLARLVKADPRFASLPLVMLTSVAMRGDAARLADSKFAAYLTKPVKNSLLYQCLQTVLGIAGEGEPAPLVTRHTLSEQARQAHILIVEDNPTNQRVAEKMLARMGHVSVLANNGREALDRLETTDFDLVLMDCQMPVMDGYEATRALRSRGPKSRNAQVPIIALTASAMQGDRELALESGMNDYLPKPFDVSAFEKTLNSWLKKASVAAQSLARAPMAKEHVYPVFEVDKVLFRFGGDLEMATLMVREGLSDLHQQISVLASVLAAGDVAAARRVAHTMKGMADSVGGEALREVALGAGKAVAEEDLLAAGAYIPQLEAELARLDTLASAWLTDHGAASDA